MFIFVRVFIFGLSSLSLKFNEFILSLIVKKEVKMIFVSNMPIRKLYYF